MSYVDYLPRELVNELQHYRESAISFIPGGTPMRYRYYIQDPTFSIQHTEIIVPCIFFSISDYHGFRKHEYWSLPGSSGSKYRINWASNRVQLEIRDNSQLIARLGSPWVELFFSKLEHTFPELNT